jgi:ABC-type phosphate transport system permease subunit
MRKLLLTTLVFGAMLAARATPARADVGLGLFLGDPTGFDLKIGLSNRSGLDILLGFDTYRDGRGNYGHLTYLVTPLVASGESVLVPVRFGIGAALYGTSNDLDFAVRAPVEVALRLRRTPLEFYGELALALTLFDPGDDSLRIDLQGGGGFRVFF